jgi:hypothetical protein
MATKKPPITPEQMGKLASDLYRKIDEMEDELHQAVFDKGIGDADRRVVGRVDLLRTAKMVCYTLESGAKLAARTTCEPFVVASYIKRAQREFEDYGRMLARHALFGHVIPAYREYGDLADDLRRVIWEATTGHLGFDTVCKCIPIRRGD